jgi:hypothetical protein
MVETFESLAPAPRFRRARRGYALRALTVASATYLILQMIAISIGPVLRPLELLLEDAPGVFDIFAGISAILAAIVVELVAARARQRQARLDRAMGHEFRGPDAWAR